MAKCLHCGFVFELKQNDRFCPKCGEKITSGQGSSSIPQLNSGAVSGAALDGFVLVQAGTFLMGSPASEPGRFPDEIQHQVTISRAFYLGKYPVTQQEWWDVMGTDPSYFQGDNMPVEGVSWDDAVEYCNKRSLREGLIPCYRGNSGSITFDRSVTGYRLPTEAEWEYAAKGGKNQYLTYIYAGSNGQDSVAWYKDNSGLETHEVGQKQPNQLGLYDMSGNVREWCWDCYAEYPSGAQTDPEGPPASSFPEHTARGGVHFLQPGATSLSAEHVARGGSFSEYKEYLRSAYRGIFIRPFDIYRTNNSLDRAPDAYGFRLVRSSLG